MVTGSKAGLYQNVQSASYLPLTLVTVLLVLDVSVNKSFDYLYKIHPILT